MCDLSRQIPLPHLGEMAHIPDAGSGSSESFVSWTSQEIGVAPNQPVGQIDKSALNRKLLSQVLARLTRYLPDARVLTIERIGGHWEIATSRGAVRAALLADATGRAASIARRVGAKRIAFDALTATTTALPPGGRAQQYLVEASVAGWWYCAHHPDLGSVASYFTDNDLRLPFQDALRGSKFARHFVDAMPLARPRVLAAATALLQPVSDSGWFAVGDAAWSSDPLSSSGISNAFETAVWALADLRGYPQRVASAFAQYRKAQRMTYGTCAQRGEFWQRRNATL
jgi:flavin-dependent dehydrogenase